MRLLVPKRVSDDDKLIEYDALLLDRFLDIVEDLHGKELKETVESMIHLVEFYRSVVMCKIDWNYGVEFNRDCGFFGSPGPELLRAVRSVLQDRREGSTEAAAAVFTPQRPRCG